MILTLRKRHRLIISVLGFILPAAFATALVARRPIPQIPNLPSSITSVPHFDSTLWERDDLWPLPIRTRLARNGDHELAIQLFPRENIIHPDVIAYWIPAGQPNSDSLPERAILLGAFLPGMALPLRTEATKQLGALLLYSLADHEIIATSKPFNPPGN